MNMKNWENVELQEVIDWLFVNQENTTFIIDYNEVERYINRFKQYFPDTTFYKTLPLTTPKDPVENLYLDNKVRYYLGFKNYPHSEITEYCDIFKALQFYFNGKKFECDDSLFYDYGTLNMFEVIFSIESVDKVIECRKRYDAIVAEKRKLTAENPKQYSIELF